MSLKGTLYLRISLPKKRKKIYVSFNVRFLTSSVKTWRSWVKLFLFNGTMGSGFTIHLMI
jgi:hypothetical protein